MSSFEPQNSTPTPPPSNSGSSDATSADQSGGPVWNGGTSSQSASWMPPAVDLPPQIDLPPIDIPDFSADSVAAWPTDNAEVSRGPNFAWDTSSDPGIGGFTPDNASNNNSAAETPASNQGFGVPPTVPGPYTAPVYPTTSTGYPSPTTPTSPTAPTVGYPSTSPYSPAPTPEPAYPPAPKPEPSYTPEYPSPGFPSSTPDYQSASGGFQSAPTGGYSTPPVYGQQPVSPVQQTYTPYNEPTGYPQAMSPYGNPYATAYNSATSKNKLGTMSLTFGIISLFCFGFLAGIPAIILGVQGRKAADQGLATNRGTATAGMVIGIIGTVLTFFGLIGVLTSY